jgi:hypothetical protein
MEPEKSNFDDLPILKSFGNLKRGDVVYSARYLIGTVIRLHHDEVVVEFSHFRKRIAPDENDLRLVQRRGISKKRPKVAVTVGGEKMSFRAYKKERQAVELQKKSECLLVKDASRILDMTPNALLKRLKEMGMTPEKIGGETMIRRLDLLALSKGV